MLLSCWRAGITAHVDTSGWGWRWRCCYEAGCSSFCPVLFFSLQNHEFVMPPKWKPKEGLSYPWNGSLYHNRYVKLEEAWVCSNVPKTPAVIAAPQFFLLFRYVYHPVFTFPFLIPCLPVVQGLSPSEPDAKRLRSAKWSEKMWPLQSEFCALRREREMILKQKDVKDLSATMPYLIV